MKLLINSQTLKKTLQILISVSLLFFSYSSWIPYLLSQLSNYSIDRSYMFLLCNGILVLLGLVGASPSETTSSNGFDGEVYHGNGLYPINYVAEKKVDSVQSVGYLENVGGKEEDVGEMKEQSVVENSFEEEYNGSWMVEEEDKQLQEEEVEEELNERLDNLNGGDIEDGHGLEELNKKFDEFIRRTKEELRFENSHRRLIMV
ncbi:hypothetical protein ACHQM5_007838 [Ranunculus cassubicifolius]